MIIYKYTKPDGIDILRNARLQVLDPSRSNDPYELALDIQEVRPSVLKRHLKRKDNLRYYYEMGLSKGKNHLSWKQFVDINKDPKRRDELAKKMAPEITIDVRKIFNPSDSVKYFFLCCFCGEARRTADEVLMWSHYTESHKGLRFWIERDELNIKTKYFEKVVYSEQIPICNPEAFLTGQKDDLQLQIEKSLRVKSISWEYEQECRWFIPPQFCKLDETTQQHYTPIDLKAIKRIDFGARSTEKTISGISQLIKTLQMDIELKRAVKNNSLYKLDYVDL